jgi:hypothetical protein
MIIGSSTWISNPFTTSDVFLISDVVEVQGKFHGYIVIVPLQYIEVF